MITRFLTSRACRSLSVSIPGLHHFQDLLPSDQLAALQKKTLNLHKAILTYLSQKPLPVHISRKHNLNSKETYRTIILEDRSGGTAKGQHFEQYGEAGHRLTYFMTNRNLPQFVVTELIGRVLLLPQIKSLTRGMPLVWNLTFNTYAITPQSTKMAGFKFHKDIESNGEVTMIFSMGAPTEFQIRHPTSPDKVTPIPLLSNSLVVLSQEARWDYEHCVIPVSPEHHEPLLEDEVERIGRISLVLGFSCLKAV